MGYGLVKVLRTPGTPTSQLAAFIGVCVAFVIIANFDAVAPRLVECIRAVLTG